MATRVVLVANGMPTFIISQIASQRASEHSERPSIWAPGSNFHRPPEKREPDRITSDESEPLKC